MSPAEAENQGPDVPNAVIESVILRLCDERSGGKSNFDKTICPSEAARAIAGPDETKWRLLMPAIRKIAVALAGEGRLVITRKGKPVDAASFKGVYRLRLPKPEE